tara:strand:- start:258 stop:524 length:267 start_codon:yes stop_codon:yes gene_type:complete
MLYTDFSQMKHMSATNVFYKVEIDTKDSETPIIYFRKARRCKTAKGADRQHNRIVNETVNDWRQFSQQIRRYTISRVPADVVVAGEVR